MSADTLTDVLVVASAWWLKSFVFAAAALLYDLRRRAAIPVTALTVALAFGLSSVVSTTLKEVVDRDRPAAEAALIELPSTASFPSGHATTAFAAAVALTLLVPRWWWWALGLAAVIAYSRVHLGVHYWSDVIVGALIGSAVAWGVVAALRTRPSAPVERPRTQPP